MHIKAEGTNNVHEIQMYGKLGFEYATRRGLIKIEDHDLDTIQYITVSAWIVIPANIYKNE